MTAPAARELIGRWRIVEADLWDRGYLDLDGPAMITIGAGNHGEIAFGAMPRRPSIAATARRWASSHVQASTKWTRSLATAMPYCSIEITLAYRNGDEAIRKAKRDTSSTAC